MRLLGRLGRPFVVRQLALTVSGMMMTFITRGGQGLENMNEDRKATRSEGMVLEESASRALMRQGGGEGCGGRG